MTKNDHFETLKYHFWAFIAFFKISFSSLHNPSYNPFFVNIKTKSFQDATKVMRGGFYFSIIMLMFAIYVWNLRNRQKDNHKARKIETFGRACLDGKFDLVRTLDGEVFSTDDLLGKWAIIYFGFTRCPDVCPEQLEKLAYVIQSVEQCKS